MRHTSSTYSINVTVSLESGDWQLSEAWMVTEIEFRTFGDALKIWNMKGVNRKQNGDWSKAEKGIGWGFEFAYAPMPPAVWDAAVAGLRAELERFAATDVTTPPTKIGG